MVAFKRKKRSYSRFDACLNYGIVCSGRKPRETSLKLERHSVGSKYLVKQRSNRASLSKRSIREFLCLELAGRHIYRYVSPLMPSRVHHADR